MAAKWITGLCLRADAIEWTVLRPARDRFEVQDCRVAELAPPPAGETVAPDLEARMKEAAAAARGLLSLALPAEKVLLCVVDLPTSDPAELQGMVELQVDKFSPFPVDSMAISFEILATREKTTRVLIVAIQREILDTLTQPLVRTGLMPHWIDVDIMGWWHLLQAAGQVAERGQDVILLLAPGGAQLLISLDGAPVVLRALGRPGAASSAEFQAELAEEIGYTLTALETEWGAPESARISLWSNDPESAALAGRLREECGLDVATHPLTDLPPLSEGIARRSAARAGVVLDLAPREWRELENTRQARRVFVAATSVFLALWLIVVSVFAAGLQMQRKQIAALKTAVEAVEGPAEEVRRLQAKVRSFEAYSDRTHSALECLREISVLLPNGVDLTSFIYKKEVALSLRGVCSSPEPIYDFIQSLEKSAKFERVKAEGVSTKMDGNVPKSQFGVTMTLPGEKDAS